MPKPDPSAISFPASALAESAVSTPSGGTGRPAAGQAGGAGGQAAVSTPDLPDHGNGSTTGNRYVEPGRPRPVPVGPVAHRGRMVLREGEHHRGWQAENHEWQDWLCDRGGDGRLVGRDPLTIPLDVLAASGHPYPRAAGVANVVSRLKVMQGVDGQREGADMGLPFDEPTRFTNVRDYCVECASGNVAEVRRCSIYDCPAWPYRMGRNPHNPQRGKDMSAVRAAFEKATGEEHD